MRTTRPVPVIRPASCQKLTHPEDPRAASAAADGGPRFVVGFGPAMRKLDIFNHIMPPAYFDRMMAVAPDFADIGKRMRSIPMLVDLDVRFRVMDRFDDYQQILSLPTPPIEAMASGQDAVDLAHGRQRRDGRARANAIPIGFRASWRRCRLAIPTRRWRSCERAIGTLGARGIQLFTNINGRPLSSPEFLPLFEAMARYDLPIWLHPYRGPTTSDYASEDRSQFEIWWTFGWPYETSVAMSRIVFAGLFDRWPGAEDHHAPHGRDGAVLRRAASARDGISSAPGPRRRRGRGAHAPAEAAGGLLPDVLRRHRAVRGLRRHGVRPGFLRRRPGGVRVGRAVRSRRRADVHPRDDRHHRSAAASRKRSAGRSIRRTPGAS